MDILVLLAVVIVLYLLYDWSERVSDRKERVVGARRRPWDRRWFGEAGFADIVGLGLQIVAALLFWSSISALVVMAIRGVGFLEAFVGVIGYVAAAIAAICSAIWAVISFALFKFLGWVFPFI